MHNHLFGLIMYRRVLNTFWKFVLQSQRSCMMIWRILKNPSIMRFSHPQCSLNNSPWMSDFRIYSNQSAMSDERRNYLFEAVWSDLCAVSVVDFKDTFRSWHEGIIAQNIHPFITPSQHPIVLSFIHLIAQGIVDEHVYLPLTLLIT